MLGPLASSLMKLALGTQPPYDEEEQATWRGHIEVPMETTPTKFSTSG